MPDKPLEDGDYNLVTAFLIKYHSLPDEEGYSQIESDPELTKDKDGVTLLYKIFKDADGLDRIRFGIKDIDMNQPRLDESKGMTMVARLVFEGATHYVSRCT